MLVHASDEAALHPQDQMQMTGEVAVILSEKPEWRARADWYHGFAPTSPSKPEELHVGEKPGESSWRGRSTASCVSSLDEVPAGVKGGECIADAGDDPIEER
jgi:hypothetical protein